MNPHPTIIPLFLALTAASLLSACGRQSAASVESTAKPALTVQVVHAQTESWPGSAAASGPVAPWQEASIGAELSGVRLDEVRVNVGDNVARGQLLAHFNEDSLRAELAQLDAHLAESEAAQAKARLDAEVADRLEPTGVLSKQEIRGIHTQLLMADARVASARASRDAQALRLSHARVLAPDSGIISARSATVGAVTMPGTELFRLIRGGRLEWRAQVRADTLASLSKGMTATIQLPNESPITGRIRQISPVVSPDTLTGTVYVDLPAHAELTSGMFLSGTFELDAHDAEVLPASAIVFRSGAQYVMAVDARNRIRELKIETGTHRDNRVEILTPLPAGARVVLSGGAFLTDGDLVAIADSTKP